MVTEAYSALLAAGISTIAVAPGSNCDDEHLSRIASHPSLAVVSQPKNPFMYCSEMWPSVGEMASRRELSPCCHVSVH